MTKLIGIFIACLLLVGGGVFIQGHFPSRLACTTEEIQRATAPDGGATAIYENAFCDENPSVLEVRVLLVPGLAVQRTSWQRIFLGQAPLVKSADRITRERKLDIKWENSTTLAITTYPEVKINAETISAGTSAIQVVINNKRLILEQDVAKLAAEQKDELHVLFIYLRFVADEKIRDDALALLYRNFGKQEFEPVVDALWNLSEKEFPDFDWQALKEPISRLRLPPFEGSGIGSSKKSAVLPRLPPHMQESRLRPARKMFDWKQLARWEL